MPKNNSLISLDKKLKYNSPRENVGEGKKNPFADEFSTQKESDSDTIQQSYTDKGSGWIPFSARDKRPIKNALYDNMEIPGSAYIGRDREQSPGELAGGMGNPLSRNNSDIAQYEKLISFPSKEFIRRERGEHAIIDETDDSGTNEDVKDLLEEGNTKMDYRKKILAKLIEEQVKI